MRDAGCGLRGAKYGMRVADAGGGISMVAGMWDAGCEIRDAECETPTRPHHTPHMTLPAQNFRNFKIEIARTVLSVYPTSPPKQKKNLIELIEL